MRSVSKGERDALDEQYARWCKQLVASDQNAFEELFRYMYRDLLHYAVTLTRETTIAEDLVQEAFLRIWSRRGGLHVDRSLRALLYVTVRNLALDQQRTTTKRKHLQGTMTDQNLPVTPEEATTAGSLETNLHRWINELPPRRREAFMLSRFDGLSYQEIAGIMGVSVKTIENHIWQALQHLRERLRAYEPDLLRQ